MGKAWLWSTFSLVGVGCRPKQSFWFPLRENAIAMENDAKSCFDQIVVSLSNVRAQRMGAPKSFLWTWGQTHGNMKHCVRTAHGASTLRTMCVAKESLFLEQGQAMWVLWQHGP